MPKYYYHCNFCHIDFYVHHMMSETQELCTSCGMSDISKLLTKPLYFDLEQKSKIGEITKQYIDDNKKILDNIKNEVKQNSHKEKK